MSMDIIDRLASAGLVHITDRIINQYLSNVSDVCHFEEVSRTWNSLVFDEFHWKYKYDTQYHIDSDVEEDKRKELTKITFLSLYLEIK